MHASRERQLPTVATLHRVLRSGIKSAGDIQPRLTLDSGKYIYTPSSVYKHSATAFTRELSVDCKTATQMNRNQCYPIIVHTFIHEQNGK